MPRGSHKIDGIPFNIWVTDVDPHNRVRIPREARDIVAWLNVEGTEIECIGTLGAAGGIQLAPIASHQTDVARFTEAMDAPPEAEESGQEWVDVARLFATSWKVLISVEPSRFSLTLPEPLRRVQEFLQPGGTVIVFGFGNILEVWDAPKWNEHIRVAVKQRPTAVSRALEELTRRSATR